MKVIEFLKKSGGELELPENYYHGLCLPEKFALPDSILLFFVKWGVSEEQAHSRYSLVIPLAPMIYCVENFRYELSPGMGLLLLPWQKHHHLPGSEGRLCERLLITFELPSSQCYLPDSPLLELSETAQEMLKKLLRIYRERRITELSLTLAVLLNELSGKMVPVAEQRLTELTAESLKIISKNMKSALDIQFIADLLDISVSHLRMVFRKDMGVSIGKYIAEQRLLLACTLLKNSESGIQQIAENCGFASVCAFSHFFKNKTGLSPMTFRKLEN